MRVMTRRRAPPTAFTMKSIESPTTVEIFRDLLRRPARPASMRSALSKQGGPAYRRHEVHEHLKTLVGLRLIVAVRLAGPFHVPSAQIPVLAMSPPNPCVVRPMFVRRLGQGYPTAPHASVTPLIARALRCAAPPPGGRTTVPALPGTMP